jgi:hypothetical protein
LKIIDILAISHQSGTSHVKDGTESTFNVNTPFQRLRPIDIPYGKTISAWAMGR